ncbi:MAG: penicillin acylase family protein [Flavobacteriales bacterium]|nr:penicillin acylase family protein [Flavobacteriales bacterium]
MQELMNDHINDADSALMEFWLEELSKNSNFSYDGEYGAYNQLFSWDGSYTPDASSPTLFNKMLYHFLHEAMSDELGEERFRCFCRHIKYRELRWSSCVIKILHGGIMSKPKKWSG